MSDYISREAAANIFSRARAAMKPQDYHTFDEMNTRDLMLLNAELAIRAIPAADVAEVRHGRWIGFPDCLKYPNAYSDDHIVCSVCEECFSILDNDTERFDFCPHCGAKMDESEDEE